jgi:alkanesulfonate monooxygenase SsuD/methylene tetrahydromethanopterin reductase-like flavin-dependent oxidoreductase (luciferase family)
MMTIREAYDIIRAHNGRAWVSIATVQAMIGGTPERVAEQIHHLLDTDEHFRVAPWFMNRVPADLSRYTVQVGGEDMHMIAWQ